MVQISESPIVSFKITQVTKILLYQTYCSTLKGTILNLTISWAVRERIEQEAKRYVMKKADLPSSNGRDVETVAKSTPTYL
jgi:hypothetical protein